MLRLHTLGKLEFEGEGSTTLSSRRKELVLLAYLARRSPRRLARAEAAALLWQDRDEHRGRQSLRQALLELRRLVGTGLMVESEHVWLAEEAIELDATVFEREVAAGRFEAAVSYWEGDFLPGVEEIGGEELRSWLESQREALRRRLRQALAQLAADARRRGAWQQGIGWAERWISALPLDQEAHLHLLRLLDLDGQTAEALSRYAGFRAQLRAADIEPSSELEQLGEVLERGTGSALHPHTSSAALFTPHLIGRGPALGELVAAWQSVTEGGSCVVIVEGELGIGKTRLCQEFLQWLERKSGRQLRLRAYSREGPAPMEYGVLAQIASGLAPATGLAGASPSALAVLGKIAPAVRERFPALPEPAAGSVAEAFREAVAAVVEEEATVLFIDDLPRADSASRQGVLSLIERPPPGLLLIATARTGDEEPPLALPSQSPVRRLKLQPLSLAEVELMVSSILELTADDRHHLAARLHTQGGGSPFYIVELVSALADEGTLAPTATGTWRLTECDSRLPLPTSLREVLTRRLARLTPSGRAALEAAAVLALPFDRELLVEVADQSPVAVETAVEELLLQRLIREVGASGRYEFAHELVRHHVDRNVPVRRGEELSSRAVTALEKRARAEPSVTPALAHHRARASALTAAASRRRRRWAFTALGGISLAAGALGVGLRARSGTPVSTSATAVLPFTVRGGPELAYLRDGIVTLLSTELDGVKGLRIADPRAVLGIAAQLGDSAPDVEQGGRVAERVRAGTYVIGDIVEGGDRIRIAAAAYRRGRPAQLLVRAEVEGTTGQLFQLVDAMAGRLLSGLSPGPFEQLTRVAATATNSLSALKAYLEGERLFRSGAFYPAARAFQRAVTEDTTFALAYYWLSVASWWGDDSG